MYYRKKEDERRLKRLLELNGGKWFRICGAYYDGRKGRIRRYYKSDTSTYGWHKKEARRRLRHLSNKKLDKMRKIVYDLHWSVW